MSDVLLKGENVKLLVDGEMFGGVTELKSIRKNEITQIGSFLSDVPVYLSKESRYEILLVLDIGEGCPFAERDRISKIEICCDGKKVQYDDCVVKNMQTMIKPKGRITAEVTLIAEERTVL